jgi:hypothetical protein
VLRHLTHPADTDTKTRIDGSRRLVDALLARQAHAQLKARDQLGIAMRQGEAFAVRVSPCAMY